MTGNPAVLPRWLLLVHQLPARPSNLRVHVWRRLQQVGAVALRNSVYVLPNTSETREDFEWVREEIASRRGQVSILVADAIDGYTDDELQTSFRKARSRDYEALIRDAKRLKKRVGPARRSGAPGSGHADVAKLRERFRSLKASDYFMAPKAGAAQLVIDALEKALQRTAQTAPTADRLAAVTFAGKTWITRPRPGIDRMASAWLIRRFIAPDARFVFGTLPTSKGRIPFDMPDVEFGHQGAHCTYETLTHRFGITDVAAVRVGHLVHDLDLKESAFGLPETQTIGRLVEGLRDGATADDRLLEDGIRVIEALYRSFSHEARMPTESPRPIGRRGGSKGSVARRDRDAR